MSANERLNDEEGRIFALHDLEILDTSEEKPFENIVDLIQQVLKVPMCAVSLVDKNRQWFKARRGMDAKETARDISFCTHAIRKMEPLVVPDSHKDPRFCDSPLVTGEPFIRSYAGIPLASSDGFNLGALCAMDKEPREFSDADIAILTNFANMVVSEMELRRVASTDQLTNVLSRRGWLEEAKREIHRAIRYDRPISVAIFDLDRFKSINDTYGHPAGDKVLVSFSDLCTNTIRQMDCFGRIGGEEFALLMPETTPEDAYTLAERLREAYAETPFDLGDVVHGTVSIGIATLGHGATDIYGVLDKADKAMYAAKNSGRNKTVIFDDEAAANKTKTLVA